MFRWKARSILFGLLAAVSLTLHAPASELGDALRALDARAIVLGKVRQQPLASMVARDVEAGLRQANRADTQAWKKVQTRADWEAFRDTRIQALRESLGKFPPVPKDLKVRVTRTLKGDGFVVDNLVFETRPGMIVTANLYRPVLLNRAAPLKKGTPGVLIALSHQQPKHVGIRQDMGMTWARAGCMVLVPDHLGHGERRQHPFGTDIDSYPHDYHFRYDLGMQLHLAGESLMGWLAWDLMRGVDLLLAQPGVDPERIVMISEPAGGGDVAAVTAALDPRIGFVMVNNFGGPEPENAYPLAKDAEESFDFAGSGSWESTRNLHLSARDGFLPWTIIASIAPRKLIYYHEFYWDQVQDPVWQRLKKVYGFYDAKDALLGMAGRGFVVGSSPENTHWIAKNREMLYPVLERWLAIPNPHKEYDIRRPVEELLCLTPAITKEYQALPLHTLVSRLAAERSAVARKQRDALTLPERKAQLRKQWARLLGNVEPSADPIEKDLPMDIQRLGKIAVERIHLGTEPGIVVPVVLLVPPRGKDQRLPIVVGLAQEGKQEFLKQRAETIAQLLEAGVAVCLPDVRGTGESSPGDSRDRRGSSATSSAASALMLGQPVLGGRLRDLRSVLRYLRKRPDLDSSKVALWGEAFAPTNPADRDLKVPHSADKRPDLAEPLGGLLALLGGLYEEDVGAVYVHRGLSDFLSVVDDRFRYVPYDVVVPGVLTVGDLSDLAAVFAPRPLRLEGLVDGLNRAVPEPALRGKYERVTTAYADARAPAMPIIQAKSGTAQEIASWLVSALRGK